MFLATIPIFDIYHKSKNQGVHFRSGGHGFKHEDFERIISFSNIMLLGLQNVDNIDFYKLPFDFDL